MTMTLTDQRAVMTGDPDHDRLQEALEGIHAAVCDGGCAPAEYCLSVALNYAAWVILNSTPPSQRARLVAESADLMLRVVTANTPAEGSA